MHSNINSSYIIISEFTEVADGTFTMAKMEVPSCLELCNLKTFHKFFHHVNQYMDAYRCYSFEYILLCLTSDLRKGLTGHKAEYVVKKFKSHCKIGVSLFKDINFLLL
jgi:hypothetical protein